MNPMHLRIIDADPQYLEQMQEVFYTTWLDTYPNPEIGITREDIEERFKNRLSSEILEKRKKEIVEMNPNKKYLIALDGEKVIGICRGEIEPEHNRLNAIYVLPEYQARGVGKALWTEIQKFFDPHKETILGVATYNQNAIAFYTKLGFKDTGRRFEEERLRMKSGVALPQIEMRKEADLLSA